MDRAAIESSPRIEISVRGVDQCMETGWIMRASIHSSFATAIIGVGFVAGCANPTTILARKYSAVIEQPALSTTPIGVARTDETHAKTTLTATPAVSQLPSTPTESGKPIQQVDFESLGDLVASSTAVEADPSLEITQQNDSVDSLVAIAVQENPTLTKLHREYLSAVAKSRYVDKLPDPRIGTNIFGRPLETAAGSQRANLSVSQAIPWLAKLNAQQQQECLRALAIHSEYQAARLDVVARVRTGWFRLYVIDKQIETTKANQQLLQSLIDVANAGFAVGTSTQGEILLGTVEMSKLEERLLLLSKQRRVTEAEINRSIGRNAGVPIRSVDALEVQPIKDDSATIHQIALAHQPEIHAARYRVQASRWGVEVARLSRRPEFMVSANYFMTDDNRPASPVVNVGEDPWSIGLQMSLPICREKYDAIANEAGWKHQAAHAGVEELIDRYDSLIVQLKAEASRANETASLYKTTIIPQAQQALAANQQLFANGKADFDRVISDYRTLLLLELGYHQAVGELAIANAKLRQAAGIDL
ncbi:TolC family protein [Stieleria sp. JC731]|uniref:TolC family protein n=1 Tax=Stieleria sp. JC731 TaxID=2894195 RepID=UPI001E2F5D08|nr:TolC family protein [Stieleria sp. JC731]MCC9602504.1 TolC family protein [Stieleria sp. JC731]